jgi:hypothetical protein
MCFKHFGHQTDGPIDIMSNRTLFDGDIEHGRLRYVETDMAYTIDPSRLPCRIQSTMPSHRIQVAFAGFRRDAFQLGGQQLPDEEQKWDLAAAEPLPNPTNLSPSPPDGYIAPFLGMQSFRRAEAGRLNGP